LSSRRACARCSDTPARTADLDDVPHVVSWSERRTVTSGGAPTSRPSSCPRSTSRTLPSAGEWTEQNGRILASVPQWTARTGRRGFASAWAGQIPEVGSAPRPVGIRQRLGRANPRSGLRAAAGGDSTAPGPVKSPGWAPRRGRRGFDSAWAGQIPRVGSASRPVGIRPRPGSHGSLAAD
jgi:hypothetical protein